MSFLAVVGLAATVLLILLKYRKSVLEFLQYRWKIARLPVGRRIALPLIGHSYLIPRDTAEFFRFITTETHKFLVDTNAKMWISWLGPVPVLNVMHPSTVETLLHGSKHNTKSPMYRFLHPWLGTGLLTAKGQKWHQRRRLITPTFHFNILQDFLEVMNEQSERMLACIDAKVKSGQKIDLGKAVTLCALDIICETAMGQTVNAQENEDSDYVKAIVRMSEIIQLRQKTPFYWPDFVFDRMSMGKEQKKLLGILHGFTRGVIEKRMKNRDQKKNSRRMAFLDVLIHAKTEEGNALSLSDIQEEVDTFMFEGHDTTAAAMTWCLYVLGRNADVQRRVHDEIDDVLGDNRTPTVDDIKNLEYLDQVTKEVLRLYPSVPLIARTTTEDCEFNGYIVPKRTQVMLMIYNVHRHPEFWDEPLKFNPDRFTKERSAGRHPYAYIPFSAGPRNCIGQKFAQMEEKVLLAKLLRRYSVTSHDNEDDLQLVGDLILRPLKPLNITIETRNPTTS